jgi:methyltransferase family protein
VSANLSRVELRSRIPKIHQGRSTTWAIHPRLADFLDEYVEPSFVTLETGSGYSTLVILRKGVARHIAIAPDDDEFQAIRAFCASNDLPTASLETVAARSQEWLPVASLPELNLVLVDGDHAFPVPFIDWYYTADRLVVGGVMIVDDIQLVTGRLLADFMDADPKWERVLYEERRFAVFRKLKHPIHEGGWTLQPYVVDSHPVQYIDIVPAAPPRRPGRVNKALVGFYAHLPHSVQALYRRVRSVLRQH